MAETSTMFLKRLHFFEFACRIIVLSGGNYDVLTEAEIDELEYYKFCRGGDM